MTYIKTIQSSKNDVLLGTTKKIYTPRNKRHTI